MIILETWALKTKKALIYLLVIIMLMFFSISSLHYHLQAASIRIDVAPLYIR